MKSILIKIIFGFCIVFSINACHTFEHENIFLQNINKNSNQKLLDEENKRSKINNKKPKNKREMAPIDVPKQAEKVKKLTLHKTVKLPKTNKFNLDNFINWDEEKLIKTLGKSHFVKEEGKLKNFQYHFKECFVDVFLLKKSGVYLVNYIEMRPTKLDGNINNNSCLKEINQTLN